MHVSKQQQKMYKTNNINELKETKKWFGKIYDFFAMVLKNEAVNINVCIYVYIQVNIVNMCYELLFTLLLLYYMVYFITCYPTKKKKNEIFCVVAGLKLKIK